jgi:hypothetical protein
MSEPDRADAEGALESVYQNVTTVADGLSEADLIATLAVEAAVHYLDLTAGLPTSPPPDAASLALVRRVLDGLLGTPLPGDWDDHTYAPKGTGRAPFAEAEVPPSVH